MYNDAQTGLIPLPIYRSCVELCGVALPFVLLPFHLDGFTSTNEFSCALGVFLFQEQVRQ